MADYDMTQNRTASNYAIQPGKSVDYPSPGTPMDPADHPATSMPDATDHHDGTVLDSGDQEQSPANMNLRQRWTGPSISKLRSGR